MFKVPQALIKSKAYFVKKKKKTILANSVFHLHSPSRTINMLNFTSWDKEKSKA